ncbi:BrnT family toxin [Desulfonatronum parangueonense]
MDFEYDPEKSLQNKKKHGIDFEEAKRLWKDEDRFFIPARNTGEDRFALIGKFEDKIWTCIFTFRNGRIRIISARRSRDGEKKIYNQR